MPWTPSRQQSFFLCCSEERIQSFSGHRSWVLKNKDIVFFRVIDNTKTLAGKGHALAPVSFAYEKTHFLRITMLINAKLLPAPSDWTAWKISKRSTKEFPPPGRFYHLKSQQFCWCLSQYQGTLLYQHKYGVQRLFPGISASVLLPTSLSPQNIKSCGFVPFNNGCKCWSWDTFLLPLQPLLHHRSVFKKDTTSVGE